MLGTAFPAARLLLVEQPHPWGFAGLRTSRFDAATALALEARGRAEGVRVQAIRRPGRSPQPAQRRWAIADTRGEEPVLRWGEFTDDAELLELPLDGLQGEPDSSPLYLVCAHGKHDPCCAARGRPLVSALADVRPGRVWQVSHLGGCRFAPSVLVLPLGLVYGRVPPSAAAELVAAAEKGEVMTPLLRGRIGHPPAAQAALGFAHQELALPRCRDVSLVSTKPVDGGSVLVRISSPHGQFRRHRGPRTRRRVRAHLRRARAELVSRPPARSDRACRQHLSARSSSAHRGSTPGPECLLRPRRLG